MKKWSTVVIMLVFLSFLGLIAKTFKTKNHIKMATTTSVENSGLLDVLLPAFEKKYGIKVHAIAVGTGKALKLAENGDVDIVLVHAPKIELEFVEKGFGTERKPVFYNDFVIVGPKEDPSRINPGLPAVKIICGGAKKASDVFRKIAQGKFIFISRGDNSGTHNKELDIWDQAGFSPEGPWYMETGQGMGATLKIANEKKGYCLVDRGTFITYENKVDMAIVFEGDPNLKNIYSIIAVNPVRHPHVKYKKSKLFINWILSEEGKTLINGLRKNGKILFNSLG